jgi:hypothetical protein
VFLQAGCHQCISPDSHQIGRKGGELEWPPIPTYVVLTQRQHCAFTPRYGFIVA